MRMSLTYANPDYFHWAFARERSNTFDWQKERAKLDRFEFLAQGKVDILRYIGKESEGKMNLIARSPANTANPRINVDEKFPH